MALAMASLLPPLIDWCRKFIKVIQNKYFPIPFPLLLSLYPLTPTAMQVLQFSVDNKFGHTQKPTDEDGGNFHADHHLLHVKNFGIYNCLTDMYFDTG